MDSECKKMFLKPILYGGMCLVLFWVVSECKKMLLNLFLSEVCYCFFLKNFCDWLFFKSFLNIREKFAHTYRFFCSFCLARVLFLNVRKCFRNLLFSNACDCFFLGGGVGRDEEIFECKKIFSDIYFFGGLWLVLF